MSTGIDFVVVSYYQPEYIEILVKSIRKYVDCPYRINIVYNEQENSPELNQLFSLFSNNVDVRFIQGTSQTSLKNRTEHWFTTADGHRIGPGSINHSKGLTIGLNLSDREYVCFLDSDALFLNRWTENILPLCDEYFLVSFWFDSQKANVGIIREMFMIFKRENFIENNLHPNCEYVDGAGNITKFCRDNNKKYKILPNSFGDSNMKRNHVLGLNYGVESYINGKPFFYHFGRGSTRDSNLKNRYITQARNYLNKE